MKDCMYIDFEGVCLITCKVCPGRINTGCKHYKSGYCELSGYTCSCGVGCAMFELSEEGETMKTIDDLRMELNKNIMRYVMYCDSCCTCKMRTECIMHLIAIHMIQEGEY